MRKEISAFETFYGNALFRFALNVYQKTSESDGETLETETTDESGTESANTGSNAGLTQADVDRIVRERIARYTRQASDKDKQIKELTDRLTEYDTEKENQRQKELEEQGKYQELLAEKEKELETVRSEKDAEIERLNNQIRADRLDREVDTAIHSADGINPTMIRFIKNALNNGVPIKDKTMLQVTGEVNADTKLYEPIVVDGNGQRLINDKGAYMTVSEGVQKILEAYPEFVLATNRGGSGATETRQSASRSQDLQSLAKRGQETGQTSDILAYMKAQREAKRA